MTTTYLNAKPSKISNIGEDVIGAKRHNFRTYEEEQIHKEKIKSDKEKSKRLKELKAEILKEQSAQSIINFYKEQFTLNNGLPFECPKSSTFPSYDSYKRAFIAYKKASNVVWYLERYSNIYLKKYLAKFLPKEKKEEFKEMVGKEKKWAELKSIESNLNPLNFCRAIQFGNSVPDKERVVLLNKSLMDLQLFNDLKFKLDLKTIAFSFGARGQKKSIAFYQNSLKVISFNRDTIGAFCHELGHAIDYANGLPSKRISEPFLIKYNQKITKNYPNMTYNEKEYYLSRKEVFARAIEKYVYDYNHFSEFFVVENDSLWPDLDSEIVAIIEGCRSELEKIKRY